MEVRCLVGHTYSPRALLHAHGEVEEAALWAAVVALNETAALVEAVGEQFPPAILERMRAQVEKKRRQAELLEEIIRDLEMFEPDAVL